MRIFGQGAAGPCGARNRGLLAARTPWVFLLDEDAEPAPGCMERMLQEAAACPEAEIISPRVLRRGDPLVIHYDGAHCHFLGEMCFDNFLTPLSRAANPDRWPQAAATTALLVRRDAAIRWGLFDEGMVFFREDLDFCLRARLLGAKIRHCPEAIVWHEDAPRGMLHRRRAFYQTRNRWWILLKIFQWRTILLTFPLQAAYEALNLGRCAAEGSALQYAAALADLGRSFPRLMRERRALQARRRLSDRDLLSAAPFTWRPQTARLPLAAAVRRAFAAVCRVWWDTALRWV